MKLEYTKEDINYFLYKRTNRILITTKIQYKEKSIVVNVEDPDYYYFDIRYEELNEFFINDRNEKIDIIVK